MKENDVLPDVVLPVSPTPVTLPVPVTLPLKVAVLAFTVVLTPKVTLSL